MSSRTPHEWSKASFVEKAQRYATLMHAQRREDWQFGFWSALCLEMLVRATVARVSPALLADSKDWGNLRFALGIQASEISNLSAKSIPTSDVVKRVEALFPAFTKEMANFCALHFQRRNAELHSGALPFDDLDTSTWLPLYYSCCATMFEALDTSMAQVFGTEESATAATLIQGLQDDTAKAVQGTIHAHKAAWEKLNATEKAKLAKQAETLASRTKGHRMPCPSCKSTGLVQGAPAGAETTALEDGVIVVRQPMLPSHFDCKACKLVIKGYSKLQACGLGATFTSTSYNDPVEYFEDEFRAHMTGYDDDNNEP
jgi:hypothetical protein